MLTTLKPPAETGVDEHEFRNALGFFASGVTVITTLDPRGAAHGMTATAFSSLSLAPPLVLIAVSRGTRCHRHVLARRRFGVSILAADQLELSRHFGGRPSAAVQPSFTDLDGLPVLNGAIMALSCNLESVADGGDHEILIGFVKATTTADGEPLVHYKGRYRVLRHESA